MNRFTTASILVIAAWAASPGALARSAPVQPRARIYSDHAHGQVPLPQRYQEVAAKAGAEIVANGAPITAQSLEGYRVLMLRAPNKEFTSAERDAIVDFVKRGGSLLLVMDEERRTPLEGTRANEIIAPFGLKLTADTPYVHNVGGIAGKGAINRADRELPYSGGRTVEGGTAFAWQLDQDGKPAQPFAAWTFVGGRGRVVVMAEGMASLLMGTAEGVRLTGVPRDASQTTYWGKDSAIFMEELLTWLIG